MAKKLEEGTFNTVAVVACVRLREIARIPGCGLVEGSPSLCEITDSGQPMEKVKLSISSSVRASSAFQSPRRWPAVASKSSSLKPRRVSAGGFRQGIARSFIAASTTRRAVSSTVFASTAAAFFMIIAGAATLRTENVGS